MRNCLRITLDEVTGLETTTTDYSRGPTTPDWDFCPEIEFQTIKQTKLLYEGILWQIWIIHLTLDHNFNYCLN